MSATGPIFCLTDENAEKACTQSGKNSLNEFRAICGQINDEGSCDGTAGCYWKSTGNAPLCTEIDSDFCASQYAQRGISGCRKDGNDFCYFNGGRCRVCNENPYQGNDMRLISVDGKSCFDAQIGCAPYFRQGQHAACRKYCEFNHGEDTQNHTCYALTLTENTVFDNKELSKEDCIAIGGQKTSIKHLYFKYVGTDVKGSQYNCYLKDQIKDGVYRLAMQNNKYVPLGMYKKTEGSDDYLPQCSQNYKLIEYHPCGIGETCESLRGAIDRFKGNARLLSYQCVCPAGYYIKESSCVKCEGSTTTYAVDSTSCVQKCPEGQAMRQDGVCGTCDNHQIVDENGRCQDCQPGHEAFNNVCIPCPRSYYRSINDSACTRCSSGSSTEDFNAVSSGQCSVACSGSTSVVDYDGACVSNCSPGTYRDAYYCVACPAGQHIPPGLDLIENNCQECPKGSYKTKYAATCVLCENGSTTAGTGSIDAAQCNVECPSRLVGVDGECVERCPDDQYVSRNRCRTCDNPQWSVNPQKDGCVEDCPGGYWSVAGVCVKCQGNTIRPDNSSLKTCQGCQVGEVADDSKTFCAMCRPGEYIDQTDCIPCNDSTPFVLDDYTGCVAECPNKQAPNASNVCADCPAGSFYDDTSSKCTRCPPGTYRDGNSGDACIPCGAGEAAMEGATQCDPCGGETPYVKSDKSVCVAACEDGFGADPSTKVCAQCGRGTAQNVAKTACDQCDDKSQYADVPGLTECKVCPGGKDAVMENGLHIGCNTTCKDGEEEVEVGGGTECKNCEPGKVSKNGSACRSCGPMYIPNASRNDCDKCPEREYSNTGDTTCTPCDNYIQADQDGTYSCVQDCLANHRKDEASGMCIECERGQFSDGTSAVCLTCPAMQEYSNDEKKCVPCGKGEYSEDGDASCTKCPTYVAQTERGCVDQCQPGTYIDDKFICRQCPAGHSSLFNQVKCTKCQPMTFAPAGSFQCRECGPGEYSGAGAEQCTACETGKYVSSTLDGCVAHCGAGEVHDDEQRRCVRCPTHLYAKDNQCIPCEPGYSPNNIQNGCAECRRGTYSDSLTNYLCVACPQDKFLSNDRKECVSACSRDEEPTEHLSGEYQCEPCEIGQTSPHGLKCHKIQTAIDHVESSNMAIYYIVPVVLVVICIIITVSIVMVMRRRKQNKLTVSQAYGPRRTVAIDTRREQRQLNTII